MKKLICAGIAAVSLGAIAPALADAQSDCETFAESNGVPTEPCSCIAEAVSGDDALRAEQAALVTLEDYENSSAELQAAVDPCLE